MHIRLRRDQREYKCTAFCTAPTVAYAELSTSFNEASLFKSMLELLLQIGFILTDFYASFIPIRNRQQNGHFPIKSEVVKRLNVLQVNPLYDNILIGIICHEIYTSETSICPFEKPASRNGLSSNTRQQVAVKSPNCTTAFVYRKS